MPPKTALSSARNGPQKPRKQTPPSSSPAKPDTPDSTSKPFPSSVTSGRPDKKAYDDEQNRIKGEIDALQVKLTAVRDKISLATKSGPGNDRETTLRAELNDLKAQQSSSKSSRAQTMERIKSIQENIQKKVKDLQASRSKIQFKTVEEVDAHIKNLEKQVESGSMKLADEKRALAEISSCKRSRRVIETLQGDQQKIEEDRHAVDELRKLLDDPEAKALSDRFEAIAAELSGMKAERDEANANKSKLFEERDSLQAAISALYNEKRESSQRYRDANDRHWAKVNEDRARREERRRAQKKAEEDEKLKEQADRLLEEATIPAYQTDIEDCQTLIDHFSGKTPSPDLNKVALSPKSPLVGVPQLELRKVEGAPEGVVIRKKGEVEESYFVGKAKTKGKKSYTQRTNGDTESVTPASSSSTASLHIPLYILSALSNLAIPPPTSTADVPRVIEDLKTKKLWFEANQARVTGEKKEKAEAEVKRLLKKVGKEDDEEIGPQAQGPAEPALTPQAENGSQEDALDSETENKLDTDTLLEPEAAGPSS